MNNKKGGIGAKILLVLILMIASAVGGAYGYSVLDGKMAARDALKAVENVDVSDYDLAEQSEIQGYIDDAKKSLETAKTRKDVYEIISDFVKDVDKVQTRAEKELEKALQEAEEAKQKYNDQVNSNKNSDNASNGDSNVDSSENGSGSDSQSTEPNDSNGNGGYKSNDLTDADDGTNGDEGGGLLNSLFGGLVSGSNGD